MEPFILIRQISTHGLHPLAQIDLLRVVLSNFQVAFTKLNLIPHLLCRFELAFHVLKLNWILLQAIRILFTPGGVHPVALLQSTYEPAYHVLGCGIPVVQ